MQEIIINRDVVELFKILKFEALATSGADAKAMIAAGEVMVNGEIETRKRRKITHNDVIEVFGQKYLVLTEPPENESN